MQPFTPFPLATTRAQVGDAVVSVPLVVPAEVDCFVWVDNRGSTDVLIEFEGAEPSDTLSFPIGAGFAQSLYVGRSRTVKLKRPSGSSSELVIIAPGEGS